MKSKKRIEQTNLLPNSNKQYLQLGVRIYPTNNSQIFGEQDKNNVSKSIIEAKLGINQVLKDNATHKKTKFNIREETTN